MVTAGLNEAVLMRHGLPVVPVKPHRERITVNQEDNPAVQAVQVSDQPAQAVPKGHLAPVGVQHHPTIVVVETVEAVRTEVDSIRCCLTARVPAYQLIPAQHKTMAVVITGPSETTGVNSKT